MTARETAMEFIGGINDHSIGKLTTLMADDHVFVDSLGNSLVGRVAMRDAWVNYFYLVPDYRIVIEQTMETENCIALFGSAEGTCRIGDALLEANHWKMPAAWRVVAHEGKISVWQVYADNEPVREILSRAEGSARNSH